MARTRYLIFLLPHAWLTPHTLHLASELDGRWQKEGGARQYLVPNRYQFSEPVLGRRLADHISLRYAVPPLELPPALSPSMRTLGRVAVAAELLDAAQTARDVAGHCCGRTSAALLTS